MTRRLRISFERPEDFRAEFDRNIAQGGLFIAGGAGFELREVVEVEIALEFMGERRTLEAEIVHVSEGAGVAVEFLRPAGELRAEFAAALAGTGAEPRARARSAEAATAADGGDLEPRRELGLESSLAAPEAPVRRQEERRRSPRARVRLPALLDGASARVEGVTRDLSETGALISADASELPPGKTVRLRLRNPETGDPVEVSGRVSRHMATAGTVAAVSVEFEVPAVQKPELAALVRAAEQVHQQRAAEGISGRIEELGMPSLIQMLGRSSPKGTLSATSGTEEGVLAFEGGNLRYVRLGATRGIKALTRILQWSSGSFEFHAHVDALEVEDEALRLEAALLEAMRRLDESASKGIAPLDSAGRFQVDRSVLASVGALAKVEEAVVDLATAGLTVRRILDVVPEDDAQVSAALVALIEQGVLRPVR